MRVAVLGCGVVGVTSAWYLAQAGAEVTVIDRQPEPGLETSFANGGQIAVSHAEPWANPGTPLNALSWLGQEDAPLLFRLKMDWQLLSWTLRFLQECTPGRTRQNMRQIVALANYSRDCLKALRADLAAFGGINYDHLERGIIHFYTDKNEFRRAIQAAAVMHDFGCKRRLLSVDECVAIEPALSQAAHMMLGGDFSSDDESGDAHQFTCQLADHCKRVGVEFRLDQEIVALKQERGLLTSVALADGSSFQADNYVLALGSYSPLMLKPLGIRIPICPAKGYSVTLKLPEQSLAPTVSLTDDGYKLVFSRLGNRLRVAGTAEFAGYDLHLNPVRLDALLNRTRALFPALRWEGEPERWCGLRPVTPSSVPLIGQSEISNLWLNIGHGTLGWTMACGSASALADLMHGHVPDLNFSFI